MPPGTKLSREEPDAGTLHVWVCEGESGNSLTYSDINPCATASRRNSVSDQRAKGRPRRDGNSQASALISTLTAGGKMRRPTAARLIFETR